MSVGDNFTAGAAKANEDTVKQANETAPVRMFANSLRMAMPSLS
jgi:hypothetical protein